MAAGRDRPTSRHSARGKGRLRPRPTAHPREEPRLYITRRAFAGLKGPLPSSRQRALLVSVFQPSSGCMRRAGCRPIPVTQAFIAYLEAFTRSAVSGASLCLRCDQKFSVRWSWVMLFQSMRRKRSSLRAVVGFVAVIRIRPSLPLEIALVLRCAIQP